MKQNIIEVDGKDPTLKMVHEKLIVVIIYYYESIKEFSFC